MSHASLRWAALICCLLAVNSSPLMAAPHPAAASHPNSAPVLEFDYSSAIADTLLGETSSGTFNLSTFGAGSITVTSVALAGANGASYTITHNTCVNGFVLDGSNSCEIDVRFAPQQKGVLVEALAITSSAGDQSDDISASGLLRPLLISPTAFDFGYQPSGTTSALRTLTLKNPNPIAVQFDYDYYPIFGTGADFNAFSTTCSVIPANGSCAYEIGFTPSVDAPETGEWFVVNGTDPEGSEYTTTYVQFTGTGVQDGATSLTLNKGANVEAIGSDNRPAANGGLDGLGNRYANDLFQGSLMVSGQSFVLPQVNGLYAFSGTTLPLTPGKFYGATVIATGVRGNQKSQAFTVQYTDGTSTVLHQSLSDWKTPQHYSGEAVAATTAYRLDSNGFRHDGPYYAYAYALPFDRSKTVASLKLPNNRGVVVLAVNLEVAGIPVTADLRGLENITAARFDGQATSGSGIDGLGSDISLTQFLAVPLSELLIAAPVGNEPDAIANVTVPLPTGQYSTLHLAGLGVRGNHDHQPITINYADGSSQLVHQGFSDWHTPQKYPGESVAVAMAYKLNADGSKHPGTYNVYQYDIPIDASKGVASATLPKTNFVVILSVALKP